ncbi:hypothetical protein COY95_02440 [Candidatus Woesearchaeota archaeon CG_4_10_14_0_8_um_filter_47_5]|nr:MAG: hypothetical protein COY95_02440 [Candidatus Woesearchaeota archaeon CG_4_10_14_0_8_um_filter_47_5]
MNITDIPVSPVFAVVAKDDAIASRITAAIRSNGFALSQENPDVVVAAGGDGTFLAAERRYPSVPKILMKYSKTCKLCRLDEKSTIETVLGKIKEKAYFLQEGIKLEAHISYLNPQKKRNVLEHKTLVCTNEFSLRNEHQTKALRFSVEVDKKPLAGEVIGDGVVIATPFGSTGYYHSITRTCFEEGIGIAFNNPTECLKPRVFPASAQILIRILRERAYLSMDNDPHLYPLDEGDSVRIQKHIHPTRFLHVK